MKIGGEILSAAIFQIGHLKLGREMSEAALGFSFGFPSVNPMDVKIRSK